LGQALAGVLAGALAVVLAGVLAGEEVKQVWSQQQRCRTQQTWQESLLQSQLGWPYETYA
jgi:hypothetical protein